MRIGVPKETAPGERRVALVPESAKKLIQAGYQVTVEARAGDEAGYGDTSYHEAGAVVQADRAALAGSADLLLKVGPPARDEVGWMRAGSIYLGSLMPLRNPAAVRALADRRVTAFSTDAIPRTTRAQSMDTLSSMANIAGYKGVLLAAAELMQELGFTIIATGGTATHLETSGLKVERINKVAQGRPHIVDRLTDGGVQLVFNTTEGWQSLQKSWLNA